MTIRVRRNVEGSPILKKTLYLLRHGESDLSATLSDFDRRLNPYGLRDAKKMGAYMAQEGMRPALVLCWAARRAVETWEQLCAGLGPDVPVHFLKTLYLASPSQILACLRRLPDSVDRVLVIGHNPGFTHLAHKLVAGGKPRALERLGRAHPAAGLAVIDFSDADWQEADAAQGDLCAFVWPQDLS